MTTEICGTCGQQLDEEVHFDISVVEDNKQGLKGQFAVWARKGNIADFAIRPSEKEAKDKALARLNARIDNWGYPKGPS